MVLDIEDMLLVLDCQAFPTVHLLKSDMQYWSMLSQTHGGKAKTIVCDTTLIIALN